jgi:hypothetical protein
VRLQGEIATLQAPRPECSCSGSCPQAVMLRSGLGWAPQATVPSDTTTANSGHQQVMTSDVQAAPPD